MQPVRTYEMLKMELTAEKAAHSCTVLGGSLAIIRSKEDNLNAVAAMGDKHNAWLGAKRKWPGSYPMYAFVWNDDSKFTYENWSEGEPNNLLDNENCMQMLGEHWNDTDCAKSLLPLCSFETMQRVAK